MPYDEAPLTRSFFFYVKNMARLQNKVVRCDISHSAGFGQRLICSQEKNIRGEENEQKIR